MKNKPLVAMKHKGIFIVYQLGEVISAIHGNSEAVVRRFSVKMAFLKIWQNSQEDTCARVSFFNFVKKETLVQVVSIEFCEISKKTFFHRTPLMATSVCSIYTSIYLQYIYIYIYF